jgi:6-phosphofructokinase
MDCSRISDRTVTDDLSKAGSSLGYVSAIDSEGRTIWIADAHRDDGKWFVVHAMKRLAAFVALESAIRSGRTPRGLRNA